MPIQRHDKTWTKERILGLRNTLDLSGEAFAHAVGCSLRTVSRWETGTGTPSVSAGIALDKLMTKPGTRSKAYRSEKVTSDRAAEHGESALLTKATARVNRRGTKNV